MWMSESGLVCAPCQKSGLYFSFLVGDAATALGRSGDRRPKINFVGRLGPLLAQQEVALGAALCICSEASPASRIPPPLALLKSPNFKS